MNETQTEWVIYKDTPENYWRFVRIDTDKFKVFRKFGDAKKEFLVIGHGSDLENARIYWHKAVKQGFVKGEL